jgi:hypothetical protein
MNKHGRSEIVRDETLAQRGSTLNWANHTYRLVVVTTSKDSLAFRLTARHCVGSHLLVTARAT